ncbi:hypothetical protein [Candidatus Macondimonas diazotrophica]|jgi:hypothetical protein|uniref:Uncharacterized protein n=1 Tax=Candidatus Macondimonas diazotrophica TaxID=2305248 RepID=A0A4Z0F827_9GAMM|nr:hypothetical protein [Candidatus Macondimonas diazotrophica]TFZ81699.1 hypothetical protein E4680_11555 [Candidatus Macondimonas diazotrophica]
MFQLLKLLKTALPLSRGAVYGGLIAALAACVIYLQFQLTNLLKAELEHREQELEIQADMYEMRVQRLLDLDTKRQQQLAELERKKNKVHVIVKELEVNPEAREWKDAALPSVVVSSIDAIHSSLRNSSSSSDSANL